MLNQQIDVLNWWSLNKKQFPLLFEIVKSYMCAMASSVPAESLFSKSGYTIWDRRNAPQKVNKIMILYQHDRNETFNNTNNLKVLNQNKSK